MTDKYAHSVVETAAYLASYSKGSLSDSHEAAASAAEWLQRRVLNWDDERKPFVRYEHAVWLMAMESLRLYNDCAWGGAYKP